MIEITVIRGSGDRPGEDIVDSLLAEEAVAVARGRNELDAQSTTKSERVIEIPYRSGVEMGELVAVVDSLQGETYRGKVTSIDHDVVGGDSPQAITKLTLEVPTEFFV